jgi:hypothetical protein
MGFANVASAARFLFALFLPRGMSPLKDNRFSNQNPGIAEIDCLACLFSERKLDEKSKNSHAFGDADHYKSDYRQGLFKFPGLSSMLSPCIEYAPQPRGGRPRLKNQLRSYD